MEEKSNGIVLGGVSYGENDKILNVFTPDKGVISAKIKGVKKAGAKLKFASEPFCFAEFVFSVTAAGRTVIGASLFDSFYPLRENIVKLYCGSAVLEFVKKFFKENISSPETFILAVNALKEISYGGKDPKAALVRFLVSALSLSGYALTLGKCRVCGKNVNGRVFFDYRTGGFYCEDCFDGAGREVLVETFRALSEPDAAEEEGLKKAVRLLGYYIGEKTDEHIFSLKELV